jgi:hypothetical protein
VSLEQKRYFESGVKSERERILKRVNDLINAVVDYTLTPSQYDKAVQRITEVVKGEQK